MSIDTADPFATTVDESDPFATPEDVQSTGGAFKPTPKPEDLHNVLMAMVPRKYDKNAPKLERFVKAGEDPYQERWTVDLFVLDNNGADFAFTSKKKDKDTGIETETEYVTAAVNMPEMFPRMWVQQFALIGQLSKIADTPRPILAGRMRRGPVAADKRAGKTFDQVEAEYTAWVSKGARGEKPAFSWQVDTAMTPEDRATMVAWWAKANGTDVDLSKSVERTTERLTR